MNKIALIIAAIVVVGLGIFGAYTIGTKSNSPKNETPVAQENATTSTMVAVEETVGWRTYKNDVYGFEFKYPTIVTLSAPTSTSREIFVIDSWGKPGSRKDEPEIRLAIFSLSGSGEKMLQEEKTLLSNQADELNEVQEIKLGENSGIKYKNVRSITRESGGGQATTATVSIITFKDKYGYSFECIQNGNNLNTCDQIVSTFKFTK